MKRYLITGASRGLGRAMAQALVEAGADLVLVGREQESLEQARQELSAAGTRVTSSPSSRRTILHPCAIALAL